MDAVHEDGDSEDFIGTTFTVATGEVYKFRGFVELTNSNGDIVIGTTATNDDAYATAETLAANLGLELSKKNVVSGAGVSIFHPPPC